MITATAEELAARIRAGKIDGVADWDLARGIDLLLGDLRDQSKGRLSANDCIGILKNLNEHRLFKHTVNIGAVAVARFPAEARLRRRFAQALIEGGALDKAEKEIQAGKAIAECPQNERGELDGLLGRILKQRYLDGAKDGNADARWLQRAIDQYLAAYACAQQGGTCWHAINLVALLHRATADASPHAASASEKTLAEYWLKRLATSYADGKVDEWELATLAEACLALGDADAAELWTYRFAYEGNPTPFQVGSLQRQLTEVWRLQPGRGRFGKLVDILQQKNARRGVFEWSSKDLAAANSGEHSEGELEKIFGKERFIGYERFTNALRCCESIGCVVKPTGEGFGSGFLLRGRDLSPQFPDSPVFLTNAHVISTTVDGALRPTEARVRFEVARRKNPDAPELKVDTVLFSSPPGAIGIPGDPLTFLDVTIVTLQGLPADATCLDLTRSIERVTPTSHAYVIGHPDGAGLQISLHDSQLLAVAENRKLVHYTTPTVGGSSGSPVLNGDWKAFAIHHAGAEDMPQFIGGDARYRANEGISLAAIINAIQPASQGAHQPT